MAKQDFSFDIVSQVSMPEVANAIDQARREIANRFDFKDTGTSISQDDKLIEVRSGTEDRLKAALEAIRSFTAKKETERTATPSKRTRKKRRAGTCADVIGPNRPESGRAPPPG